MVPSRTIHLAGTDPHRNLEIEQAMFEQVRGKPAALCLFYVNRPCIVLGRNNIEQEWVNRTAADDDCVPVLRRFSGGGTVYHDQDTLNYSFIIPRSFANRMTEGIDSRTGSSIYIDLFRSVIIEALTAEGIACTCTRVSDISLNGRKISGNAQRIAGNVILHHGTILMNHDSAAIDKYLPIPPDREGIPHAGFISSLKHEGLNIGAAKLKRLISTTFHHRIRSLKQKEL